MRRIFVLKKEIGVYRIHQNYPLKNFLFFS